MFFAIAALLIHPQIAPTLSFSAEKIAVIQPALSASNSVAIDESTPVVADMTVAEASVQPAGDPIAAVLPDAPMSAPAVASVVPAALILAKPSKPMTVSVDELLAENRLNRRVWTGLGIASHSAAAFDAWTTRQAITTKGAIELNPFLKPFAGNASLYAAIQVGPALMDYAGKKMMYSKHSWVRHMWWVPQSASFISSLFCGSHNLSFHQ
jgi:hypothetical protein